jgi:hypothetical protein
MPKTGKKVIVSEEKAGDFRFADYMNCNRIFMFGIEQIVFDIRPTVRAVSGYRSACSFSHIL